MFVSNIFLPPALQFFIIAVFYFQNDTLWYFPSESHCLNDFISIIQFVWKASDVLDVCKFFCRNRFAVTLNVIISIILITWTLIQRHKWSSHQLKLVHSLVLKLDGTAICVWTSGRAQRDSCGWILFDCPLTFMGLPESFAAGTPGYRCRREEIIMTLMLLAMEEDVSMYTGFWKKTGSIAPVTVINTLLSNKLCNI